jgi:ABC-2 type transport system ATP-binding protein
MLRFGRELNPLWDDSFAVQRMERWAIPLDRPLSKLSGGQQAQVALLMALAKSPQLLLVDEPVAALDPLARRAFFQTLMEAVAERGITVLISSHQVADLDRICDSLILLSASRLKLSGAVEALLQEHHWVMCPSEEQEKVEEMGQVLEVIPSKRSCRLMIRSNSLPSKPGWDTQEVSLEDMILAYLALSESSQRLPVQPYQKPEVVK